MSFRLAKKEILKEGIHRVTIEQIDKIFLVIENELNRDEAVHSVRKKFKKLRAVLRLIRDELGEDTYKKLNVLFRNLARDIAPVRDSLVLIKTLHSLDGEKEKVLFDSIEEQLKSRHKSVSKEIIEDEEKFSSIKNELNDFKPPVSSWEISSNDFSSIKPGLKRVYKRGRNAIEVLEENPDSADFHEFRKRVKYLWYHTRILRALWKDQLKPFAKSLHTLSDLLGDDHDLFVLSEYLRNMDSLDEADFEKIERLINSKRKELQKKSIFLGRLIYAESTNNFIERIKIYWKISRIQ